MFKALRYGKASKFGTALQEFDQSSLFSPEDLLTSSIFERLQYLPAPIFAQLVSEKIKLPEGANMSAIRYWPRWEAKGKKYVEPDLLVQFNGENKEICDIIVEAKRGDLNNSQSSQQWVDQLNAYFSEDNELYMPGTNVYFLAIGGKMRRTDFKSFKFENDKLQPYNIIQLDWSKLAKRAFEISRSGTDNLSAKFILSDVVEILSQFGFFLPNYLNELKVPKGARWKEKNSD